MEFFLFIIHYQPWFPLEPGLVGSPPHILILCPSPTASRPHLLPPLLDSPCQSPGSNNENRCMLLWQIKSQVCFLKVTMLGHFTQTIDLTKWYTKVLHILIAEKICLILDRSDWSGNCLFRCLHVVNVNILMFKWYTWNWKCHSSYFSIHEGVINQFPHV